MDAEPQVGVMNFVATGADGHSWVFMWDDAPGSVNAVLRAINRHDRSGDLDHETARALMRTVIAAQSPTKAVGTLERLFQEVSEKLQKPSIFPAE